MQQQVVHVFAPYLLGMYPDFPGALQPYRYRVMIFGQQKLTASGSVLPKRNRGPTIGVISDGSSRRASSASILHFHISRGRVAVPDTPHLGLASVGGTMKVF